MSIYFKPAATILIIATWLVWSSCRKTPVHPEPEAKPKILAVALDPSYMGAALIDSAVATWDLNGQQTRIALTTSNDTLLTNLNQLAAGSGTLTVQVFSKLKFGNFYKSQWIFSRQATISPNNDFSVSGPKSFSDQQWKPRVELKDAIGHFAIVALRPDDPYFFVKDLPGNLESIIVSRDYWRTVGGVNRVGGGQWECSFNCTNSKGHVENTQFFSFLPAQMGTSSWNHIEITVLYAQDQWGGAVLDMNHSL